MVARLQGGYQTTAAVRCQSSSRKRPCDVFRSASTGLAPMSWFTNFSLTNPLGALPTHTVDPQNRPSFGFHQWPLTIFQACFCVNGRKKPFASLESVINRPGGRATVPKVSFSQSVAAPGSRRVQKTLRKTGFFGVTFSRGFRLLKWHPRG